MQTLSYLIRWLTLGLLAFSISGCTMVDNMNPTQSGSNWTQSGTDTSPGTTNTGGTAIPWIDIDDTNGTWAGMNASWMSTSGMFGSPISDPVWRVTKKEFWTYVTPTNSPVSQEKFTGYHVGTDFEIMAWEEDEDITIEAICDGPVIYKNWTTGYGGTIVQSCMLDGQSVTVLYGHLDMESITLAIGDELDEGDNIGLLGAGMTEKTDGERKHLHLSIHKWTDLNLRWYADTSSSINDWLDPMLYIDL